AKPVERTDPVADTLHALRPEQGPSSPPEEAVSPTLADRTSPRNGRTAHIAASVELRTTPSDRVGLPGNGSEIVQLELAVARSFACISSGMSRRRRGAGFRGWPARTELLLRPHHRGRSGRGTLGNGR